MSSLKENDGPIELPKRPEPELEKEPKPGREREDGTVETELGSLGQVQPVEPKRWWIPSAPLEPQEVLNRPAIEAAVQPLRDFNSAIADDVLGMIYYQITRLLKGEPYCDIRTLVHSPSVRLESLARALAAALFRDERAFLVTDVMNPENSDDRLFGPPPGYRGSLEGGVITNHLKRHPASVTIVSNFEYADETTLGRVDRCGREGHFLFTMARGGEMDNKLEVFGPLFVLATTRTASLAQPSSSEDTLRSNLFESLRQARPNIDWDWHTEIRRSPLWCWHG